MSIPEKRTVQFTEINKLEINPEQSLVPLLIVGDRVLIEPIAPDKYLNASNEEVNNDPEAIKTKAIIEKAITAKEPFMRGVVKSFGGGEYGTSVPKSLAVGLTVNYWHQQAIEYVVDKKPYHMVRVSDIFMYL